jgi:antitoxin (DNA-binding transcriptional repressor) of toxin-antitoxin stability system
MFAGERVWVRTLSGTSVVKLATTHELHGAEASSILDQLVDSAARGYIGYITRDGQPVAAIVSADVAASLLEDEFGDDTLLDLDDARHGAGPPEVADLARQQGVPPVTDPAERRGRQIPDIDELMSVAPPCSSQ